ncbi:uncharacterized protein LOC132628691 [Lycium barbarum]|uniref:uncharacterized protein LOC132628691 n=1 Tax=Lycium barbarum TaxID=112863 RepID=UPI00293E437F|nr:uncharacterized protein LOC132628691 [Lycium barbarum]
MIEGDSMPLEIHNDMSVRVYVELKKDSWQFGMYPLCITTTDNVSEYIMSSESVVEGEIPQIEYNHQLQIMNTDDSIALVASTSGQPIVLYNDFIISNRNQKEIMVNQVYSDKDTLKVVITKYAIDNRFQFRTENSNSISYTIAYRAKEKAMTELRGEPADLYKKLPAYVYILDKTYPGSHIRMHKSPENEFLYLFVALYAFIKGFDCCRPIVVVDGSHLKQEYTGTFVSARTLDGAGNILPLAYGVIDSENDKSWSWFFQRFREAYGVRDNMCIVSDRHESIIKAVCRIYPNVPHLACIWHLWKNVYNRYRKSHEVLSGVYYKLAKAYAQNDFDMLMEKVEKEDIRVKEYLELAGREKWARLYCPVNRAWTLTSNIAESINAAFLSTRELPIYDFLEEVRLMYGRWNCTNRQNGSYTFTTLGKKIQEFLSINEHKSTRMRLQNVPNGWDTLPPSLGCS